MSLPFNIAIDGYSSCGKSTIAKSIASKYGMCYIDTGAMYRAITLYCIRNGIVKNKEVDFQKLDSQNMDINLSDYDKIGFVGKPSVLAFQRTQFYGDPTNIDPYYDHVLIFVLF